MFVLLLIYLPKMIKPKMNLRTAPICQKMCEFRIELTVHCKLLNVHLPFFYNCFMLRLWREKLTGEVFLNVLDISMMNTYILLMAANLGWKQKCQKQWRAFTEDLGIALAQDHSCFSFNRN